MPCPTPRWIGATTISKAHAGRCSRGFLEYPAVTLIQRPYGLKDLPMPLEAATTIPQLVPANPIHTDGLNQADSHLRMIKQVLVSTFPNLTGPATAGPTDLVAGIGAAVSALTANAVNLNPAAGALQTIAGPLAVNGTLNCVTLEQNGVQLIPRGIIVLWAGLHTDIPAGWNLCDSTNGTPDLRDRFIVGSGLSYGDFQTGGAIATTTSTGVAGYHSHGGVTEPAGAVTPTGGTDIQGTHSHSGATAGHTLTIAEMPQHNHVIDIGFGSGGVGSIQGGTFGSSSGGFVTEMTGNSNGHAHDIFTDGAHQHNLVINAIGNHAHNIDGDGNHTHVISFDQRAPYFALAYLMKL